MSILNKLTLKHLKLNKKRTVVTIIGIILSTALMVGVGLLISSLRNTMIEEIIMSEGNHHVVIRDVDKDKLEILDQNSSIKKYNYKYVIGMTNVWSLSSEYPTITYVNAYDQDYLANLEVKSGRLPQNSHEIVLPNSARNDYQIGDKITLKYGDRYLEGELLDFDNYVEKEEEFILNGKMETYEIVGFVDNTYYMMHHNGNVIDIYTLADLDQVSKLDVLINYKKIDDTYDITRNVVIKNLGLTIDNVNYNDSLLSMYGVSGYSNINDFLARFLSLFLTIISVACIIVIYNSFAISVMERKKQFGLFSSIGATKKQIMSSVLFEAFVVGSIGIILGILSAYIGIGITLLVIDNLLKDMLSVPFKLATYPLFIIIPVIFMIVVILISAILPARRASKISPIEVIRGNDDIKINKRKIKTGYFAKKIFGIEGEIALKNIKRNKKKYRITIISLFISIVTFIAFSSYLSFGTETAKDYIGSVPYDINIYVYEEAHLDKAMELTRLQGVDEYLAVKSYPLDSKGVTSKNYDKDYAHYMFDDKVDEKMVMPVLLVTFDSENYQEYIKSIEATENDIIMYNRYTTFDYTNNSRKRVNFRVFNPNEKLTLDLCYLDNYKYYDGDKVDNSSCQSYKTLTNFKYVDTLPELAEELAFFQNGVVIVSPEMYQEIVDTYENKAKVSGSVNYNIFIKSDDYTTIDKVAKENSDYYSYNNLDENFKMQNNFILAVEILLYGFIALITLIGVTSVFNTINTSINLRRKEFAVLRSIGLTPQGFNKMIWYESLIFGLKSLLYGLPVGIILSYLIYDQMSDLVEFNYHLPIKIILICVFAVFLIVIITMRYATNKIKHENILDSIRNENI